MKSLFFLVLSPLIVFGVSAQRDTNLNREVVPPLKPLDNSTRIVYPSEDTNMNRRPSHVSSEVNDELNFNWHKFLFLIIKHFKQQFSGKFHA